MDKKIIMTVPEVLEEAAKTFRERQPIYGDNWLNYGPVVKAMFPKGVELRSVDDHIRFQLLCLIMVKWTRYAENFHKGGHEDSSHDNITYTAMLHQYDLAMWAKERASFAKHMEVDHRPAGANGMSVDDVVIYRDPKNGVEVEAKIFEVFHDGEFNIRIPAEDSGPLKPEFKTVKWRFCRPKGTKYVPTDL